MSSNAFATCSAVTSGRNLAMTAQPSASVEMWPARYALAGSIPSLSSSILSNSPSMAVWATPWAWM